MPTFGRNVVTVDGVDTLVKSFTREALTIAPRAGAVVLRHAKRAADKMRSRAPIDSGDTMESISADDSPTFDGGQVYADAGADWFVARFVEHGTVKMPPQPIAGPVADGVLPELAKDIRDLPKI